MPTAYFFFIFVEDECVALSQDADCVAINCSRYRLVDRRLYTRTVEAFCSDLTGIPIGLRPLTGRSDKECRTHHRTIELVI
jgi:hypothetical protein